MSNPWDNDPIVAPARGGMFQLPPTPRQARQDVMQEERERRAAANEAARIAIAQREERRKAAEWAAKFNPDGSPKAGGAADSIDSPEKRTREAQAGDNSFIETGLRNLGISAAMNDLIPTGRFNARISAGVQEFPDAWKGKDNQAIAAYQTMAAKAMDLLKPAIALSSPPGTGISSKETDAARELELAMQRVPRPENEPTANRILTDNLGQTFLDRMAYNTFMNTWRERNGSIYAKNKQGQDALSAWRNYKAGPVYQRTVARPFTDILREKTEQVRRGRNRQQRISQQSGWWGERSALSADDEALLAKYRGQ